MLEIYSIMFYKTILTNDVHQNNKKNGKKNKNHNRSRAKTDLTNKRGSSESLLPWLSAHTSWASTGSRCCPCSPWHSPAGSRKAWAEWRAALWRSSRCRAAGTHADGPRSPSHKPPASMKQRRSVRRRRRWKGGEKIVHFASFHIFLLQVTSNSWSTAHSGNWNLRAKHLLRDLVGSWLSWSLLNPVDRLLCVSTRGNSAVITEKKS